MIYVITRVDVDDVYGPNMIGYVTDESTAQRAVETLTERQTEANKLAEVVSAAVRKFYDDNPSTEYERPLDVPKWKSGLGFDQITDEMREERARIQAENAERTKRNMERIRERSEAGQRVRDETLDAADFPDDVKAYYRENLRAFTDWTIDNWSYSYYELEELDIAVTA